MKRYLFLYFLHQLAKRELCSTPENPPYENCITNKNSRFYSCKENCNPLQPSNASKALLTFIIIRYRDFNNIGLYMNFT
jgi:hypothetical protein